jgi:hypothetical protein
VKYFTKFFFFFFFFFLVIDFLIRCSMFHSTSEDASRRKLVSGVPMLFFLIFNQFKSCCSFEPSPCRCKASRFFGDRIKLWFLLCNLCRLKHRISGTSVVSSLSSLSRLTTQAVSSRPSSSLPLVLVRALKQQLDLSFLFT